MKLEKAISLIANGQRVCPRCNQQITVDRNEGNIHFCPVPAPELLPGSVLAIISGTESPHSTLVIVGRRDPKLQKAVMLLREKYRVQEVAECPVIQVIVP